MPASNTKDCIRSTVGHKIIGVLFDALPLTRRDLAAGTKTLVFEDGTGITFASNGSFWRESKQDIDAAIRRTQGHLDGVRRDLEGVLELAGAMPTESS